MAAIFWSQDVFHEFRHSVCQSRLWLPILCAWQNPAKHTTLAGYPFGEEKLVAPLIANT
jgi:hypothetical protein